MPYLERKGNMAQACSFCRHVPRARRESLTPHRSWRKPVPTFRSDAVAPVAGADSMTKPFPETMDFTGMNAPVRIEADIYDLVVVGEIPREIHGRWYRATPDPQY